MDRNTTKTSRDSSVEAASDSSKSPERPSSSRRRQGAPCRVVIESGTSEESMSEAEERSAKCKTKCKGQARKNRTRRSTAHTKNDSEQESEAELSVEGVYLSGAMRRKLEQMPGSDREAEVIKHVVVNEMRAIRTRIRKKLGMKLVKGGRGSSSAKETTENGADRKNTCEKRITDSESEDEKDGSGGRDGANLNFEKVFGRGSSDDDRDAARGCVVKSSESRDSSSGPSSRSSSPAPAEPAVKIQKFEPVACVRDLLRMFVSRSALARIVHAPFFADTVIGCFVRIGIGPNGNGQSVYRVAEVISVLESTKIYTLEKTSTNKALMLRYGKNKRGFRLAFLSNAPFTNDEFLRWFDTMEKERIPMITMDVVEKKEKAIRSAMNHVYTNAEIDLLVKEKQRFMQKKPNCALKKYELLGAKRLALQNGDLAEAHELQMQIDKLEADAAAAERARRCAEPIVKLNRRNSRIEEAILSGKLRPEPSSPDDEPFRRKNSSHTWIPTRCMASATKTNRGKPTASSTSANDDALDTSPQCARTPPDDSDPTGPSTSLYN